MKYLRESIYAFIKLNKGMMKMPIYWQLWLMLMVAANAVTPLLYLDRLEARVVLVTFVASVVLTTLLTGVSGYTRLLGLGHIFWVPLIIFLWSRVDQIPVNDFFGIWVRALMAINAVSLVIDFTDVFRYIAGDRKETVNLMD